MTVQTSSKDIDFSVARPGTNVVLVVEKKEIHVNKELLSAFSPYFNTLLQSPNFTESSSHRVEIDHDYNQLLRCIQIVHQTGPLPKDDLNFNDVVALMSSADRFDLPVVRRFCELDLMGRGLNGCDTVHSYLLASHYKFKEAKEMLAKTSSTEDFKKWYDCGAYELEGLSVDEMDLHLTPMELHKLIRKVIKATKEK